MHKFSEIFKKLRIDRGFTQGSLAEKLAVKPNTISNYENGVSTPDYELLLNIVKILDTSSDYILGISDSNTSSSLVVEHLDKNDSELKILPIVVNENNEELIPLVRTKAVAGYVGNVQEPEYISSLPSYKIPSMTNGTYRMFEISGHSMLPTIHNLDIVVGEFMESVALIRDDRLYVVVTIDSVLVKRCLYRERERKLILKSDNADQGYPSIIIDDADVVEVWYVKMNLSRQLSPPTDIYKRVNDIEADMLMLRKKVNDKLLGT